MNEHIIAGGWPGAIVRQARLVEAIDIIAALFQGGSVNHRGEYFQVDSAKLWDLPDVRVPNGVAVSGKQSCELFRWSLTDWKVNAELPGPAAFDSVAQTVRPEDVAEVIPCGNDVCAVVRAAGKFFAAGYTDLVLVQVGGDQQASFLEAARTEIFPELRK